MPAGRHNPARPCAGARALSRRRGRGAGRPGRARPRAAGWPPQVPVSAPTRSRVAASSNPIRCSSVCSAAESPRAASRATWAAASSSRRAPASAVRRRAVSRPRPAALKLARKGLLLAAQSLQRGGVLLGQRGQNGQRARRAGWSASRRAARASPPVRPRAGPGRRRHPPARPVARPAASRAARAPRSARSCARPERPASSRQAAIELGAIALGVALTALELVALLLDRLHEPAQLRANSASAPSSLPRSAGADRRRWAALRALRNRAASAAARSSSACSAATVSGAARRRRTERASRPVPRRPRTSRGAGRVPAVGWRAGGAGGQGAGRAGRAPPARRRARQSQARGDRRRETARTPPGARKRRHRSTAPPGPRGAAQPSRGAGRRPPSARVTGAWSSRSGVKRWCARRLDDEQSLPDSSGDAAASDRPLTRSRISSADARSRPTSSSSSGWGTSGKGLMPSGEPVTRSFRRE